MQELKKKNITPPGGWRYVDSDTGYKFKAPRYSSLQELANHVTRYRNHNNLPGIPNLSLVIEDWLCCQPDMAVHCKEAKVVSRKLAQYLAGARAAAQIAVGGDEAYESQVIAEKRAALCVNCRYNKQNEKDSRLERYTDRFLQKMVGSRRTSLDDQLWSCEVCTCPLRPKVHVAQNIVTKALSRAERRILANPIVGINGKTFRCWQMVPVQPK